MLLADRSHHFRLTRRVQPSWTWHRDVGNGENATDIRKPDAEARVATAKPRYLLLAASRRSQRELSIGLQKLAETSRYWTCGIRRKVTS
jgi:hypothetical protein